MNKVDSKLAGLAREANEAHLKAQDHYRRGVEHAISAGRALNKAKRHIPHGQWGVWLAKNFDGSERLAQIYMRMARRMFELDDEIRNDVAEMSLREAVKVVAEPRMVDITVRDVTPPPMFVKVAHTESDPVANPKPPEPRGIRDVSAIPAIAERAPSSAAFMRLREACASSETIAHLEALIDLARAAKPDEFAAELAANTRIAAADLEELVSWLAGSANGLNEIEKAQEQPSCPDRAAGQAQS